MSAYPSHCPNCKADMDGGPIPESMREHYSPPIVGIVLSAGLTQIVIALSNGNAPTVLTSGR